ncbi:TonB-dependent receptor [Pseudomaricurvus alkylphenolicus]|jgi:iron complex outermembrane receptor protein|uniref:TonB-dependent receptor n=1 Tax=Pseudomaricurvus alkylphenolicus TaxID=1306991 RepID=UPI0014216117|nr:TonB-dependent receptor [Pseudomaricurvus alkylphenolicus]NIB41087.1 TonB-dependent receptor [Pseudomaricurvus alkylphenolicus]
MFKQNNRKITSSARLALAIASLAGTEALLMPVAYALEIEEVIVQARKREESLQDVPIAVSAFSGDMLNDLGVKNAGDIATFTPNFTWHTEFGMASPQPYLRGIGTNNFAPINNGPIAVYQDNVFIGPNIAQGFATFDSERAEVLKGPQGTLYGRNSTGGLINFISRKPEVGGGNSGYIKTEIGSFQTTNIEGAYGFELGDNSAARFAFVRNLNQGAVDNINPNADEDRTGAIDDMAARFQIAIEPNDDLAVLINTHYGKSEPDTSPFKNIGLQAVNPNFSEDGINPDPCPNPGLGSGCTDLFTGFVDDSDMHTTSRSDDFENVKAYGAFLQLDYDISSEMSLHSLTSYDYAEIRRWDDVDDGSIAIEDDFYADDFHFWSQELRLSGMGDSANWHLGLYYYNETAEGVQIWTNPIWGTGEGNEHEVETTSYAVFGQYDFNVTDKLRMGLGLRWTYEEKDVQKYNGFLPLVAVGDGFLEDLGDVNVSSDYGVTVGTPNKKDWDEITGRISLDYTTDDQNLIYAALSRGFKGGDVNGAAFLDDYVTAADRGPCASGDEGPNGPQDRCQSTIDAFQGKIIPVDPEILDAFEIGFKGDFLDGNLRLNAAAFYYIYKEQQNTILQPNPAAVSGPGITTLSNAGRSEIPGVEMELIYTPTDAWYLQLNLGLLDPEYEEFRSPIEGGSDFSGNQISLTPERSASALVRYDQRLDSGAVIAWQTDVTYQSSTFFQPSNTPLLSEGGYSIWGARVSYTEPDDQWTLALHAKNLGDKEYFGSGFDVSALGWMAMKPGQQRYIGLSFDYQFGQ